jgi:trehalose 6-phosphate phosphatase
MMPLFSKAGLIGLEAFTFTDTLYAFDFDGTLAPIVQVPSEAVMPRKSEDLFQKLLSLAPVAILSGRSVADLTRRLKVKPHYLVGNHGLEGLSPGASALSHAKQECEQWVRRLEGVDLLRGIEMEDKEFTLALHYRRSRSKKMARDQILTIIGQLHPVPRVIPGKFVFNLIPNGGPHKGMALTEIMRRSGMKHALYFGDDDTDEDVFSLGDENQITGIRVGKKRASQAKYYIPRQSDLNKVLKLLISFHVRHYSGKVQ